MQFEARKVYVDVADQGDDYLCALFHIVSSELAYIIDVEYTQENAEITEPNLTRKIIEHEIENSDF